MTKTFSTPKQNWIDYMAFHKDSKRPESAYEFQTYAWYVLNHGIAR